MKFEKRLIKLEQNIIVSSGKHIYIDGLKSLLSDKKIPEDAEVYYSKEIIEECKCIKLEKREIE